MHETGTRDDRGDFGIDARRVGLEETITRLQQALKYWQIWIAEYEGLLEELRRLNKPHSDDELVSYT